MCDFLARIVADTVQVGLFAPICDIDDSAIALEASDKVSVTLSWLWYVIEQFRVNVSPSFTYFEFMSSLGGDSNKQTATFHCYKKMLGLGLQDKK